MKKLLLSIIILLAMAVHGWGASYYAQGNCEITACEWDTTPTGGGTDLTWASLANGDNLYANAKTITIENNVGSGSVTANLLTTAGAGTAGGTFTYAAASISGKVLYVNLTAGADHCLAISGAAGAVKVVEIIGTITGSSTTAGKYGVNDTHTGATSYIVATGAKTGGSGVNSTAYYSSSATGYHTLSGNATGAGGMGVGINTATAGSTQAGDCTGGNATAGGIGCSATGAGALTVTGNIINGTRASGDYGTIIWTPVTPADGVTGHYTKYDGGGTAVFVGKNTDDVSKALDTFYYIDPTDGGSDVGTATIEGGSGGAWGF